MVVPKGIQFEVVPHLPADEVEQGLQHKLDQAHLAYFEGSNLRQSIIDIGIVVIAQHGLKDEPQGPPNPFRRPTWLPLARASLSSFIEEDPEQRDFLKRGIYFIPHPRVEYILDRLVQGSVSPGGIYTHSDFAAGVASGLVVAKPYPSVSKRTSETSL
ncbi:MAG: hypothetical protein ACR2FM_01175 [Candidatus Saccharimonadales bacterium]